MSLTVELPAYDLLVKISKERIKNKNFSFIFLTICSYNAIYVKKHYKGYFMKSNIFLHFITGCFVFLATFNVYAAPVNEAEAVDFANTKGKELIDIFQEKDLKKRYSVLDELIIKHIDIDYISKFVIGKYWRVMTPEQKKTYKDIFVRYGLAAYKNLPLEYAKDIVYKIMSAKIEGQYTNVLANIKVPLANEQQEITVAFRMHKTEGVIKLVDVKVAESSLLLSYRGKFYEMIAQSDNEIDWFLEDLSDMASSMEYNLRQKMIAN